MPELEMGIRIDTKTFQLTASGNVTGILYFEVGQTCFPDEGWFDFVVVILSWWLDSLEEIMEGRSNVKDLLFMEGPSRINIQKVEDAFVAARFIDRKGGKELVAIEITVLLSRLVDEVLQATRYVLEECKKREWRSPDINNLHQQVLRLDR